MKIGIGVDHGGYEMKQPLIDYLRNKGYEVADYGTNSSESCDYPIYGEKVALAILNNEIERGILICGTGVGIGLAANKYKGIRCATCSDSFTAEYSRKHNDANIISFGARVINLEKAKELVDIFLTTEFEGGERHLRRVGMLKEIENKNFK